MSQYLTIAKVQCSGKYIAKAFEKNEIAKVKSVYFTNNGKTAHIAIDTWCDTESAYNFIKRLHNPRKNARLVYHQDNSWVVKLDTRVRVSKCKPAQQVCIDQAKTSILKSVIADMVSANEFDEYMRELSQDIEFWYSEYADNILLEL